MKTSMKWIASSVLATLVLSGCDDNDNSSAPPAPRNAVYEVTYINTTLDQPISPVALIAHNENYRLFDDGARANEALERMAEGGDNSLIISEAQGHTATYTTSSTSGPIAPASNATLRVQIPATQNEWFVTSVGMLVNTNDAFAGANHQKVSKLAVGQSVRLNTLTWDSGTEANDEAAGTIPGPADTSPNKVGFDPARTDSIDRVRVHAGVLTQADGLATSVLGLSHRFDAPALTIRVTRVE